MFKQSAFFVFLLSVLFNFNTWTMMESDVEQRSRKGKEKIVEGIEEERRVLILARNETRWILNAEGKDLNGNVLFQVRLVPNEVFPIGEYKDLKDNLRDISFKSAGQIKKYAGSIYPYQMDAISYAIQKRDKKQSDEGKPLLPLLLISVKSKGYWSPDYSVDLEMLADDSSILQIIRNAGKVYDAIDKIKEERPGILQRAAGWVPSMGPREKPEVTLARRFLGILGEVKYSQEDIQNAFNRLVLVGEFAQILGHLREIDVKVYKNYVKEIAEVLLEALISKKSKEEEELKEELSSEAEEMKESVEFIEEPSEEEVEFAPELPPRTPHVPLAPADVPIPSPIIGRAGEQEELKAEKPEEEITPVREQLEEEKGTRPAIEERPSAQTYYPVFEWMRRAVGEREGIIDISAPEELEGVEEKEWEEED